MPRSLRDGKSQWPWRWQSSRQPRSLNNWASANVGRPLWPVTWWFPTRHIIHSIWETSCYSRLTKYVEKLVKRFAFIFEKHLKHSHLSILNADRILLFSIIILKESCSHLPFMTWFYWKSSHFFDRGHLNLYLKCFRRTFFELMLPASNYSFPPHPSGYYHSSPICGGMIFHHAFSSWLRMGLTYLDQWNLNGPEVRGSFHLLAELGLCCEFSSMAADPRRMTRQAEQIRAPPEDWSRAMLANPQVWEC